MIAITGTGRCGTTFLMILFTILGFNTGWTEETFQNGIYTNCNSGLENIDLESLTSDLHVVKHPHLIYDKDTLTKFLSRNNVECVIIPIRTMKEAADSRERISGGAAPNSVPGGLWQASNSREQAEFYRMALVNYLEVMVTRDVCTVFLSFKDMVDNPAYLYNKLIAIFEKNRISFATFETAYIKASEHQRKQVGATSRPPDVANEDAAAA